MQLTNEQEKRFMHLVKRLKAAYDICTGSEALAQSERDHVHFYLAVRSIVAKLTRGEAPDTAQMNARVREMISEALRSEGVEEILRVGEDEAGVVDIFDDDYLARLEKIKLPNTKIKLLQQLLARALSDFRKVNKARATDFSQQFQALVNKYNERDETSAFRGEVADDFVDNIISQYMQIIQDLKRGLNSFEELDISLEEKAFYDILLSLMHKYDFNYPEDRLLDLARAVKALVDDKALYTDWSQREDVKAELKADLVILLAEWDYPPVDRDEVYREIFEQAENFKRYQAKN